MQPSCFCCLQPCKQGICDIIEAKYTYTSKSGDSLIQSLKNISDSNFDYFKEGKNVCKSLNALVESKDPLESGKTYKEFMQNCKVWLEKHKNNLKDTLYHEQDNTVVFIDATQTKISLQRFINNSLPHRDHHKPIETKQGTNYEIYTPKDSEIGILTYLGNEYKKDEQMNLVPGQTYISFVDAITKSRFIVYGYQIPIDQNNITSCNKIEIKDNGILYMNDVKFDIKNYKFDNFDVSKISHGIPIENKHKLGLDHVFVFGESRGQYRSKWVAYWIRFISATLIAAGVIANFGLEFKRLRDDPEEESDYDIRQLRYIFCIVGSIFSGLYWFKDLHQSCLDTFKIKEKYSWYHLKNYPKLIKFCEIIGFCCCNKTYINDPTEFDLES